MNNLKTEQGNFGHNNKFQIGRLRFLNQKINTATSRTCEIVQQMLFSHNINTKK